MMKLEMRMPLAQLLPQPPDAEIVAMDIDVMQQGDAARGNLRQPVLKIMPHRVIAVQPVEMQQVYRTVLDPFQRFVKGTAQKRREGGVSLVVKGAEILVGSFVVKGGVRIAFPRIDGKAPGVQPAADDGMAERRIRHAV